MKRTKAARFPVLLGALALLLPATASADVITSPFTAARVTFADIQGQGQWACFEDKANPSNFQWFQLGDTNGLFTNFAINMLGGNDDVSFAVGSLRTMCGAQWSVNELRYNGFFLDVDGAAGSDGLFNVNEGDSWLWGGDQGDQISSACDNCQLVGGNHRDTVKASGWFGADEKAYGESGDDCLWDRTGQWNTMDGGSGNDAWQSSGSTVPSGTVSIATTSQLKWGSATCLNFSQ